MIITDVLMEIGALYLEMAPYIFLGLLFVGILHISFSKEMVLKHVGKKNIWSVIKASLLGVPLPLCSCGVVPTSIYMANNGASKGSVVSFLISTPQTGIDSIVATYGMMGWVFAIFRPLASFIMGITGGAIVNFIDRDKNTGNETSPGEKKPLETIKPVGLQMYKPAVVCEDDSCGCSTEEKPNEGKIKKMFRYSFVEFLDDIAVNFLIGLIISGLIAYFVPAGFFENSTFNSGILGMLLMIAIGAPMYVCATASIPIALTLIMKGFSPGLAFVFLAVGPATNAASFTIIMKALGRKLSFVYLAVISILAIVFGYLLDWIFTMTDIDIHGMMTHSHENGMILTHDVKVVISLIFLIFLLMSLYRKLIRNKFINKSEGKVKMESTKTYLIDGMSCNHCAMTVKSAIGNVKGVEMVTIDAGLKKAEIKGDFNIKEVEQAVKSAGYTLVL